ncbi:MAG: hypothetical protein ABIB46_06025 [bacterium]
MYTLNLSEKKIEPIIDTPWNEIHPYLTEQWLFFSANYDKIHSIYSYNLKTKKIYRITQNGYATWPAIDNEKNMLYFVGLTANGFDLFQKKMDVNVYEEFSLKEYSPNPLKDLTIKTEIKKCGYLENLKTLTPKNRFFEIDDKEFSISLGGVDAVSENAYELKLKYNSFKKKLSGNIVFMTDFFSPSFLVFQYDSLEESINGSWAYPLISKMSSSLSVSLAEKYSKTEKCFIPKFCYQFAYPELFFFFDIGGILEHKSKNHFDFDTNFGVMKYIYNSELDLSTRWFSNTENLTIRGYEKSLSIKDGGVLTIEYSLPLCKIRKGLWNPNIFLGDTGLTFFTDLSWQKDKKTYGLAKYASFGIELQQEIGALLGFVQDLGKIGIAINKEKQTTTYFNMLFAF